MLTKSRKLLITLPVTLFFSVTCWAQTTAFEGDVKGEDGKGVQGAMVHIDRKDIKGNYKVKTDKKGHYYYGGLPIGTYRLSVEVDGKERDSIDNVRSKLGDPTAVPFDLKEAAARAAAAAGTGGPGAAKEVEKGMSAADKAAYEKKLKEQSEKMAKNKELNDAFNAGVEAQNNKQWDVAVQNFEKAASLDATQNVVFGRLADSYVSLAQTKTGADQDAILAKAVTAYQKAIELKPDAPEYPQQLCAGAGQAEKVHRGEAELTKAAQLDPTQAGKYYYNMGAVHGEHGPDGAGRQRVQESHRDRSELRRRSLSVRHHLIGKATTDR